MTTAIVLLVVVLLNHYLQKVSACKDFDQANSDGWIKTHCLPTISTLKACIHANGPVWVTAYLKFLLQYFSKVSILRGIFAAILLMLPVVLVVYLLNEVIFLLLGNWGSLIFMGVVMLYCLNSAADDEYESILILVHERVFGIIFWFVIFGAPGAIFYWFLTIAKASNNKIISDTIDLQAGLDLLHALAAWLPSRITGLIYALVGDFEQAFSCWYTCMRSATIPCSAVLLDCGQAALHVASKQDEKELVVRSLVAWVILGMLIALIMHKGL